MTTVSIGLAQFAPRLGALDANLARHVEFIRIAKRRKLDLLVFPELSLTGYFVKDLVPEVAIRAGHPVFEALRKASETLTIVAGGVEEGEDAQFYNSAFYFEQGALRHVHRKAYLPTYGLFDEQRYFARGDRLAAFDGRFGRTGLLICEDLWHLSAPYVVAADGAQLLIAIAASPGRGLSARPKLASTEFWEHVNQMYAQGFVFVLVFVNRTGFEDGVNFWGGSEIVAPTGKRLAKAKYFREDLVTATVDLRIVRQTRVQAPLMRDERTELTLKELQRIHAERFAD